MTDNPLVNKPASIFSGFGSPQNESVLDTPIVPGTEPETVVEEKEEEEPKFETWEELQSRWGNIAPLVNDIDFLISQLKEQDDLFGMQQISNARKHLSHAKGEIKKAFLFECQFVSGKTGTPCPFNPFKI